MNIFSDKDYRFNSLEELKMEKFQLKLRIQLLKEDMGRSAVEVRNTVGHLALKSLVVPVAAKLFVSVYKQFVSEDSGNAEDSGSTWISAIPSILKGVKQGLDIYDRIASDYPEITSFDFEGETPIHSH